MKNILFATSLIRKEGRRKGKFRVIQPEEWRSSFCFYIIKRKRNWNLLKKSEEKGLLISFFFFVFVFVFFFFHRLESEAGSVGKSVWTEGKSRKFSLASFSWRQYYYLVLKPSREVWDMVFLPWFALQIHQVLRFNMFLFCYVDLIELLRIFAWSDVDYCDSTSIAVKLMFA